MTERDRLKLELAAVVALEISIRRRMGALRQREWRARRRSAVLLAERRATYRDARAAILAAAKGSDPL